MKDSINSYSNILKSIGIFGGVNIIQIILSLVKNKFVAIILGPTGMGVNGMIISTNSFVKALTSFGLHTSSVREIAKSKGNLNDNKIAITITVVRYLVFLTGLLGLVFTFIFAKQLSVLSFGNSEYSIAFRITSLSLLFDQLWVGQNALLQGTFHYRDMAMAAILGSLIGIIVSIPLYYVWGKDAIAPVIVCCSLITFLSSWNKARKLHILRIIPSKKEMLVIAKSMLLLGFALSITSIVKTGSTYLLRSYISRYGILADLGLYTAGIAIANQYVDVILQAMGSDYSPRLASISHDNTMFIEAINRQMKLLMTIITPLIILFVLCIKYLIVLLYSDKFLPIVDMVEWIMVGMFFRAFSWCLSYAIVAKGASKVIMYNEIATAGYSLFFSIVGYSVLGFTGLGIAVCCTYVCYSIHMLIVCKRLFSFTFEKNVLKEIIILTLMIIISITALKIIGYSIKRYIIGIVLLCIVCAFCAMEFNKMIPIKQLVASIKSRINNN